MANPAASPAVSSTVGLKNMVIAPLTADTEETLTYGALRLVAVLRHPSRLRTATRMYSMRTIRNLMFCIPTRNCRLRQKWLTFR